MVISPSTRTWLRDKAASDQESLRLRPGDEIIISAKDLYDGKVVG